MRRLNQEELKQVEAGGFSFGIGLIIGGIATFLIGLFDGYVRPLACR